MSLSQLLKLSTAPIVRAAKRLQLDYVASKHDRDVAYFESLLAEAQAGIRYAQKQGAIARSDLRGLES